MSTIITNASPSSAAEVADAVTQQPRLKNDERITKEEKNKEEDEVKKKHEEEDDDDDDLPSLSADLLSLLSPEARAALDEHRASQARAEEKQREAEARIREATAEALTTGKAADIDIGEDFGLSQFWYTDESADLMAQELIDAALASRTAEEVASESSVRIACVSAPSAYRALKRLNHPLVKPFVFEYDRRFAVYGSDFVFYDFNEPSHFHSTYSDAVLGGALRKSFHALVADPPYLNVDCMSKTGETLRLLARSSNSTPILFNTGAILRRSIRLILGLRACTIRPKHRVQLMNEFVTYANFQTKRLGGFEKEEEEEEGEDEAETEEEQKQSARIETKQ